MAGRRSAKKEGDGGQKAGAAVTRLISESALRSLIANDDSFKNQIDGITGELREEIGNAVSKKHLNKRAYAMFKRLHRYKDAVKRANDWEVLLAMMDLKIYPGKKSLRDLIEDVGRLPLEEEPGEEDGDNDGKMDVRSPVNVHALPARTQ